ncbi:hypothetical protein ACFRFU_43610 [Streptomyces sp. NPDC056704]|uniref:hypothetical protein n=1 Tax=Streptomyces sp. NPDC056704 TaxID=3345917 RepID=UPI003699C730
MNAPNRIALAVTAVATAAGLALAAPAAQADITVAPHSAVTAGAAPAPVQAQATWHTIWQSKFKPRHAKWVSQAFGVHDYNVTVKYQCWNGGDGTRATVKLVEADYPYRTLKKHSGYCNGAWHSFESREVKPSTRYKIVVQQNHGRTHTEQVGVYEKY